MKILVVGGTRFFGIPMIEKLLQDRQEVTIATRGNTPDPFRSRVRHIQMDRSNPDTICHVLSGQHFDVIIDKIAYCSNGDPAPYNGAESYTLNTDKAESSGYRFSDLNSWIYQLLDLLMQTAIK